MKRKFIHGAQVLGTQAYAALPRDGGLGTQDTERSTGMGGEVESHAARWARRLSRNGLSHPLARSNSVPDEFDLVCEYPRSSPQIRFWSCGGRLFVPVNGWRLGKDHEGGVEGAGRGPAVAPLPSTSVSTTGRAISEEPSAARGVRLRGTTVCVVGGRTVVPPGFDGGRVGASIGFPVDRVAGRTNREEDRDESLPCVGDAEGCAGRDDGPTGGRDAVAAETGGRGAVPEDAAGRLTVEAPVARLALEEFVLDGLGDFDVVAAGLAGLLETAGF